jgi:hypothetical protein
MKADVFKLPLQSLYDTQLMRVLSAITVVDPLMIDDIDAHLSRGMNNKPLL